MEQDANDQVTTLDFGLQALEGQIVVLQDEQMEIVSNCEPWTVRRLASHALNNQLFWAGTVTGEETVSFEATMGVYAVVLLAVLVGFLCGMIAAWLMNGTQRRERKRLRGRVKDLEDSLRVQDHGGRK